MKIPKIPENETERLAALKSYNILDTLPEGFFDDLTLLASQICGTPIALVSLIDENRQWFKSHQGTEFTESPRDLAFCAHAINENKVFIVEDSTADDRFKDNPLVTGPTQVQFYAGAQLTTPGGFNIGTLCVLDQKPKQLTEQQIHALSILAKSVVSELERRVAFERLKKVRKNLDDAQRLTKIGSWEWEVVTDVVTWSENQYELFGLDRSFLLTNRSYQDCFSPKSAEARRIALAKIFEDEKDYLLEHEVVKKDGTVQIFLEIGKLEKLNGKVQKVIGTMQDVTASRMAEKIIQDQQVNLVTSSKFSALGEMAGSIAHEINNPLAIIKGKTSLLKDAAKLGNFQQEKFVKELGRVEETVGRVSKIIGGLQALSRNSEQDPLLPAILGEILSNTLELCREKIVNHHILLRLLPIDPFEINCRETQITQIFLNLLSNAIDAVENLDEKWIEIKAERFDGRVRILITDSGQGISPEVAKKITQPFFTTKGVGKGTGLGLSISLGLAEGHGGTVYYDPERQNTCFVLELPIR